MEIETRILAYIERKLCGKNAFTAAAASVRTLIKFFEDHDATVPAESPLRECLAALEAGERSKAIEIMNRTPIFCNNGLGDWFPPVQCQCENEESVSVTFQALLSMWVRQMQLIAK